MQIEIINREYYITQCKLTIARVEAARLKEDKKYETQWRRQWPERYWRNEDDMPPENYPFYPAIDGWKQMEIVTKILKSLQSTGTGTIHITKEEFDYLDINHDYL